MQRKEDAKKTFTSLKIFLQFIIYSKIINYLIQGMINYIQHLLTILYDNTKTPCYSAMLAFSITEKVSYATSIGISNNFNTGIFCTHLFHRIFFPRLLDLI